MTLFHFLNCAILCYAPSFIVYRALKLSDYRAAILCFYAGIGFALTELLKMLAVATFVPSSAAEESGSFSLFWEILRQALFSILDFVGLSVVLTYVSKFPADIRIVGAGIGWSTAKAVIEKLLPLWLSAARSLEFDWNHITTGLEANINLLYWISFTTFVWLSTRSGQRKKSPAFIYTFVALAALYQVVLTYARSLLLLDQWILLFIHLCVSIVASMLAKSLFS